VLCKPVPSVSVTLQLLLRSALSLFWFTLYVTAPEVLTLGTSLSMPDVLVQPDTVNCSMPVSKLSSFGPLEMLLAQLVTVYVPGLAGAEMLEPAVNEGGSLTG
jgi:hypothetical protein